MNRVKKYIDEQKLKNRMGRANYRLEVGKLVENFRQYYNNASEIEKLEIQQTLHKLQTTRNNMRLFIWLAGLGCISSIISITHISCDDLGFILPACMGAIVGKIGLSNYFATRLEADEGLAEYEVRFRNVTAEAQKEIFLINEMNNDYPKPKFESIIKDCSQEYLEDILIRDASKESARTLGR